MARHISRKELKSNALAEGLTHGAEAVAAHKRLTEIIAAAVLIVLIAGFGWRYYSQRQTAAATAAFDDAMKVYNARIRAVGEPEVAGETTYVDEKNKLTDAAKHFTEPGLAAIVLWIATTNFFNRLNAMTRQPAPQTWGR